MLLIEVIFVDNMLRDDLFIGHCPYDVIHIPRGGGGGVYRPVPLDITLGATPTSPSGGVM